MIDLKLLRKDPEKFREGAKNKGTEVDIDLLLELDAKVRSSQSELEQLTSEKNKIAKSIGALMGRLKKAEGDDKTALESELAGLKERPNAIKARTSELEAEVLKFKTERDALWLMIPQPADPDVPVAANAEGNVEISRWNSAWYDVTKSFEENKGFKGKSHLELGQELELFDFKRGVRMAGSRSYVLTGAGMQLHQAILRYAFDRMVNQNGFTGVSVPVIVREECMLGTAFFPHGKDQSYHVNEAARGGGHDLYLTGTGEVGLMGLHQDEILNEDQLPLQYTTVSTCFRREAGAAGRDTAGLYRIHQFEKVEQVVICKADEQLSRQWHKKMMSYVEELLKELELPHRFLQCCTGDLGVKNADMIDIECWMPSRGNLDDNGIAAGDYGETHSASRLYDFQCRRLNIRYRDKETKKTVMCHSLNNTVAASPRILIPIIELYQNEDGSITVPTVLQPYMNGLKVIQKPGK